jgi:NAD-dependent dihydropyrimidine dehydrogenase PreA subunit
MPRSERDSTCGICVGMEPQTIDRLLAVGYGPRFISARWGHDRKVVAHHRDRCLVGDRLAATEADLVRLAGGGA